jgi:hypothetical protein
VSEQGGDQKRNEIVIHIDRKMHKVDQATMTGVELRRLSDPSIGADYDLFLEVPGGEDKLVGDEEMIELKDGMHFFSVQRHITPGS